ncbi:MAG: rhomboid family protein [Bryobacteraceae bacterium]
MSVRLADQRCWIHEEREAAARCLPCRRFFCRECITEHAGEMICAECVARNASPRRASERSRSIRWTALALAGVFVAWLVFYYLGQGLAQVPSDFHI